MLGLLRAVEDRWDLFRAVVVFLVSFEDCWVLLGSVENRWGLLGALGGLMRIVGGWWELLGATAKR